MVYRTEIKVKPTDLTDLAVTTDLSTWNLENFTLEDGALTSSISAVDDTYNVSITSTGYVSQSIPFNELPPTIYLLPVNEVEVLSDGVNNYPIADKMSRMMIEDKADKDDIPTVNNATLTIQKNGTNVQTFTANASSNATANITVPTDTGDLTNGAGFLTSSDISNMVTTDTAQDITARKTFFGEKAIYFKQSAAANKLGFTLYNTGNTEVGAFEYRPNTISGGALLNVNCSYSSTGWVGFRYWGTAVNIVAPKVATAGDYYIPVNITDGNTTVTANNAGTVNISSFGYIKGINSGDVTTALGYTPADDSDVVKKSGTQTVGGDITFTGKLSFNLPCFTASNGNNTNTPYKKIATIIRTGTTQTCNIPFMFCTTNASITSGTYNGKIVCRTGSTAGQVQNNQTGIVLNGNPDFISNGNIVFYLLYKNNAPESNQAIFEVWVYVKNTYQGVNIMPLRIGTGSTNEDITAATWSETSYSALPSDYTVKNQIIL